MNQIKQRGMGWKRDLPDLRDYTPKSAKVEEVLQKSQPLKSAMSMLSPDVDLRPWCSPVEDQENIGSCTANAGVGLMEYFQRRAFGKHLDASRLFLYKVTRNLEGDQGDTGAYLRTTMKAVVLFGIPPTKYWQYNVADFDVEPPAFCYSFAQSYKAIRYYRLDPPGQLPSDTLGIVKTYLASGLPSMFGFSVYSSIPDVGGGTGEIPFPQPGDGLMGGHAVVAIGYDDSKEIAGDSGALLIRNSWSKYWGEGGYGWLPYAYVVQGLAVDFWSLVDADFVDTDFFR